MRVPEEYKIKNTIKFPTSIIVGGLNKLGFEIADSLIEQNGYVIIVDSYSKENIDKLNVFPKDTLISFIDYTSIPHLEDDLRRLDYVFYFNHEYTEDLSKKVSTQDFLNFSNSLDSILNLASKFDAKFLLTTAIKAHQEDYTSLAYNHMESKTFHKTYNTVEVQKYSESLVMEYVNNTNLDARIVRIAELIGEGLDFSKNTFFVNILLEAVNNDFITLEKDGLDNDWYVHMLDAAYGIIKAQFTKETKGKLYSIAYERPFSHLSVAYTIQEVESNPPEIHFVQKEDNLPNIKLYKPAPNLNVIGWEPKIEFEKAVKQSLSAAKIYKLEAKQNEEGNVVSKLKSFLTLAETQNDLDSASGPVSRLIAERKRQDELKRNKLELVKGQISRQKRTKPRTFSEKLNNYIWDIALRLGRSFNILKNKSPLEIAYIMTFIALLGVFYFAIISPSLVLVKNYILLNQNIEEFKAELDNNKFDNLENRSATIKNLLDEDINILDRYAFIANILTLDDELLDLKNLLEGYRDYADGLKDVGTGTKFLIEYKNSYKNNLTRRSSTESYLSVSESGLNYENILLDFGNNYPFIESGLTKLENAQDRIESANYAFLPGDTQKSINSLNDDLVDYSEQVQLFKDFEYIPEIVGVNSTKTYAVIVLDNTRLMPIGGEANTIGIFSMQNGSIAEVIVQPISNINFDFSSINEEELNEINLKSFIRKDLEDLEIRDIGNISNIQDYNVIVKDVLEDTYSREINGIILINLNTIEELINFANNNGKTIEYNSTIITSSNLLTSLKTSQIGNESLERKSIIISEIFSEVVNSFFESANKDIIGFYDTFAKSGDNQSMILEFPDLNFSETIETYDLNASNLFESDVYFDLSVKYDDDRVVNLERYPSYNLAVQSIVGENLDTGMNVVLTFPNIGLAQEISFCVPLFVSNANISVDGIPSTRVAINSGIDKKCVVAQVLTETEIEFNFTTASQFNVSVDQILLNLGISKIKGAQTTLDFGVLVDSSLGLPVYNISLTKQNQFDVIRQPISKDFILSVGIIE